MPPPFRPVKSLLVANRGEIAIRILQAAHELPNPPTTYALYTDTDTTHVTLGRPDHALKLVSPASYMDINALITLVKQHRIDAIHPGYGFLSESAEFSQRMWEEAGCVVVGPGWEVLERTGDKLRAKELARECGVPVLKAMEGASRSVNDVRAFMDSVGGRPIMVKAVDGGGGRGIRLVRNADELRSAVERCIGESPSKTVFAEQAAVDHFKHVEVQIIGDGKGKVWHLWERDCSVQRRFQKIVEVAPTPVDDRGIISEVIQSAVGMAEKLRYRGLGTFEYLVSLESREFFFLEINPRVQVEHTISECIAGVDLVREQLLIAQDAFDGANSRLLQGRQVRDRPPAHSIQLRLCAEDPDSNFSLSVGKVTEVVFPTGNGVRVDSHLSQGGVIGSDFDNLLAKIIVTAATWDATLTKAKRALAETRISGVKTNLNLLRAIVMNEHFRNGHADTNWLEANLSQLVQEAGRIGGQVESANASLPALPQRAGQASNMLTSSNIAFRRGDAWKINLEAADKTTQESAHHLSIERVIRNEFPDAFVADIAFTAPGQTPLKYKAQLESTTASSASTASTRQRGDPSNKSHIVLPMSGKLVEVLVDEGDEVKENDIIAFVKQMKMELEIRSPRAGVVEWVIDIEKDEGDDVPEGVLLVKLASQPQPRSDLQSKL